MKLSAKIIIFIALGLLLPTVTFAQYGLSETAEKAGLKTGLAAKQPAEIVGMVIGSLLSLLGVIFLVLMIYGGYLWMTSFGNEQKVTKAKDLLTNAAIGLIIIVAAYTITHFVINALVGKT